MSDSAEADRQKEGRLLECFVVVSGLLLFVNLWARSLENHGYLRYAEVAREMIRSGEWVVPHLNGEIFVDKPPLLFWLIALPSSLYGSVTPLIARLSSFFSAWMGVIIVTLWGKKVYGTTWAGIVSGGVLLSSYQFFFQSRLAKTDILLCCLILSCLYFFYLGYKETRRRRFLFQGLCFLCMGLASLTKGPSGCVMPFLVMVAFLVKEKRIEMLLSKEFILGYLILGLTVLPWVFLFIHRVGWQETIALVEGNQILSRRGPFYFYLVGIWGEFFPASVFLPLVFMILWRQRKEGLNSGTSFFLIWFLGFFLLLTFFKFKASRYLLPALPPVALMIGGIAKKKTKLLLLSCFVVVLVWHGTEIYWIRHDLSHSRGMVLAGELRPYVRGSMLYGLQLDISTVEGIDFYLDRVIPNVRKVGNLQGEGFILMPRETYEEIRTRNPDAMTFVQEFRYKEGKLVLASFPARRS